MAKTETLSIKPLGDRVVVKPEEKEQKTRGGILIPDTANKEKPATGTVVAVGPGRHEDGKLVPMTLKVGDKILFSKYGYDEVKMGGEEYFVLSESSVLAVLTK
jgi:chaperonin GroES